jgi:hypothetical protein
MDTFATTAGETQAQRSLFMCFLICVKNPNLFLPRVSMASTKRGSKRKQADEALVDEKKKKQKKKEEVYCYTCRKLVDDYTQAATRAGRKVYLCMVCDTNRRKPSTSSTDGKAVCHKCHKMVADYTEVMKPWGRKVYYCMECDDVIKHPEKNRRVLMKFLPPFITESELKVLFDKEKVTDLFVMGSGRDCDRPTSEAHICFSDPTSARIAVAVWHQQIIGGHPVSVFIDDGTH